MALLAEATVATTALNVLAIVALTLAGARLLWSAHVDRTPRLAARRDARIKPYVSPYAKPLPQQAVAPRLAPGAELQKLTIVLDRARTQIQAVNSATSAAARQIDGAEMALNRLLADIAGVMPQAIQPTIVPRRPLSVAAAERSALAA
jgi:hypothetical protein